MVGVDDTSDRVMVYTACAVFLYGGTSDHPLPPLTARQHERESTVTVRRSSSQSLRSPRVYGLRRGLPWKRVRTTSSGWRAATVANPAAAPAAAFSHVHASASAAAGEVPGGISGERSPLRSPLSLRELGSRGRRQIVQEVDAAAASPVLAWASCKSVL